MYVQYTSPNFKKFPQYCLTITDQIVSFLVDSGATHVLKAIQFNPKPPLSGKHVYSIGSSGQTIKENITIPLQCEDGPNSKFTHSFLLSQLCPINLMGRDLMCKLNLCLISTHEGIKVCKMSDLASKFSNSFVQCATENLNYTYYWQMQNLQFFSTPFKDIQNKICPVATEFQTPENLQCISHVSARPDEPYEKGWWRETTDTLSLDHVYCNQNKCAVSVSLTPTQLTFFSITSSVPHIPMSKRTSDNWYDLGPFVKKVSTSN
ncbi:hypothetical protein NQD34_003396 [Periophthalmus magnuspinnatus]|nr:hypothetical protein NQD34_003396 [Periophthalmus magnuspinnatus]